jgi:hypothetical protein
MRSLQSLGCGFYSSHNCEVFDSVYLRYLDVVSQYLGDVVVTHFIFEDSESRVWWGSHNLQGLKLCLKLDSCHHKARIYKLNSKLLKLLWKPSTPSNPPSKCSQLCSDAPPLNQYLKKSPTYTQTPTAQNNPGLPTSKRSDRNTNSDSSGASDDA